MTKCKHCNFPTTPSDRTILAGYLYHVSCAAEALRAPNARSGIPNAGLPPVKNVTNDD